MLSLIHIFLAGDHLGPLTWQKLPEAEAMKNSVELVYQYARAGFTKIHLDTSMKVADDPAGLLKTEVIARRGAALYKAAMKGYEELKAEKPDAMRPVFVIGSEVPIPGGATEAEDTLAVTSPDAFRDTVSTYQRVWTEEGVGDGMKDVIAAVSYTHLPCFLRFECDITNKRERNSSAMELSEKSFTVSIRR